jgi:hypothetical protein
MIISKLPYWSSKLSLQDKITDRHAQRLKGRNYFLGYNLLLSRVQHK